MSRQGYAVIVVAEGAGESLLNEQQRNTTSSSSGADDKKSAAAAAKGGSIDSPAFGLFLKTQIEKHFVSKGKQVRIYMCVCIVRIVYVMLCTCINAIGARACLCLRTCR